MRLAGGSWLIRGALAALVACSGREAPGVLVLGLDTDLPVPEDVASVGLYVSRLDDAGARTLVVESVQPTQSNDGGTFVRFAASLVIEAGQDDEPGRAQVRFIGFAANGSPLVMRESRVTIPDSNTKLLRMPLLFVASGAVEDTQTAAPVEGAAPLQAQPGESDVFARYRTVGCAADQTIGNDGECRTIQVAADELVDLEDTNLPDEPCFSAAACFDQARVRTLPFTESSIDVGADVTAKPAVALGSGNALRVVDGETYDFDAARHRITFKPRAFARYRAAGFTTVQISGDCAPKTAGIMLDTGRRPDGQCSERVPVVPGPDLSRIPVGDAGRDATIPGDAGDAGNPEPDADAGEELDAGDAAPVDWSWLKLNGIDTTGQTALVVDETHVWVSTAFATTQFALDTQEPTLLPLPSTVIPADATHVYVIPNDAGAPVTVNNLLGGAATFGALCDGTSFPAGTQITFAAQTNGTQQAIVKSGATMTSYVADANLCFKPTVPTLNLVGTMGQAVARGGSIYVPLRHDNLLDTTADLPFRFFRAAGDGVTAVVLDDTQQTSGVVGFARGGNGLLAGIDLRGVDGNGHALVRPTWYETFGGTDGYAVAAPIPIVPRSTFELASNPAAKQICYVADRATGDEDPYETGVYCSTQTGTFTLRLPGNQCDVDGENCALPDYGSGANLHVAGNSYGLFVSGICRLGAPANLTRTVAHAWSDVTEATKTTVLSDLCPNDANLPPDL